MFKIVFFRFMNWVCFQLADYSRASPFLLRWIMYKEEILFLGDLWQWHHIRGLGRDNLLIKLQRAEEWERGRDREGLSWHDHSLSANTVTWSPFKRLAPIESLPQSRGWLSVLQLVGLVDQTRVCRCTIIIMSMPLHSKCIAHLLVVLSFLYVLRLPCIRFFQYFSASLKSF